MMAQIGPLCLPLCSALKQFPALEVNDGVRHNTNITFLMNSYRLLVLVLFRFTVLFFCMCIVQDTGTGLNLNHQHHDINNRLKWHWKLFLCIGWWNDCLEKLTSSLCSRFFPAAHSASPAPVYQRPRFIHFSLHACAPIHLLWFWLHFLSPEIQG